MSTNQTKIGRHIEAQRRARARIAAQCLNAEGFPVTMRPANGNGTCALCLARRTAFDTYASSPRGEICMNCMTGPYEAVAGWLARGQLIAASSARTRGAATTLEALTRRAARLGATPSGPAGLAAAIRRTKRRVRAIQRTLAAR